MRLDFALVIGVILLVDQCTKLLASAYLNYGEPISLCRSCLLRCYTTPVQPLVFWQMPVAGSSGYFSSWLLVCPPMRHGHYVILTYVGGCRPGLYS